MFELVAKAVSFLFEVLIGFYGLSSLIFLSRNNTIAIGIHSIEFVKFD